MAVNASRPMSQRRTRADMGVIRERIYEALEQDKTMTMRQLFYRLVSNGTIGKTENEYKSTVVRLTGEMRLRERSLLTGLRITRAGCENLGLTPASKLRWRIRRGPIGVRSGMTRGRMSRSG